MDRAELEASLLKLIADCSGTAIPIIQLQDMAALVKAGEPGVALENLCTQLFEYDVPVGAAVVARIARLGRAMGLDEACWVNLAELGTSG